jgi:hypothetical protein
MSYLRPARPEEIRDFLLSHADLDAQEMAEALSERFDILTLSNSPQ